MKLSLAFSALIGAQAASRELSQQRIGIFTPITQVTDHAAIDLDQLEIETLLAEGNFGGAQAVYEQGANSKSIANLAMDSPLPVAVPAGTAVSALDSAGVETIAGKVYKDASAGSTSLQVQYATSDDQLNHVACRVGGSSAPITNGCFAPSGTVAVNNVDYTYTYNIASDTFNDRTIQGFSTDTNKHRYYGDSKNNFYPDFDMFQSYYGSTQYADKLVTAAFTGTNAGLSRGNQNYVGLDEAARKEGAKKGTAYLNIFMYVIRELEDAVDDCEKGCDRDECNDDAVHALDEAVAFYTGSLEGGAEIGNLLYALAEKRCVNFSTCGTSMARVNEQVFVQFKQMQDSLLRKECSAARMNKERIADLMYVPMIQGTLRYAYFQDKYDDETAKSDAEGAAFMAAVLPKVHMCSPDDAEDIYSSMSLGNSGDVDFGAVKRAFERNYRCMKITCEDVGGLSDGENYLDGAAPCSGGLTAQAKTAVSLSVVGSFAAIALLGWCFIRSRSSHTSNGVEKQLEMNGQDLA